MCVVVRNFDPFTRKDMAMAKTFANKPVEKQKAANIGVQRTGGRVDAPTVKDYGEKMKACEDTAHNVLAAKKPMELAIEQEDASNRQEWILHNAHARWINEGRPDGHALRHWYEAEMAYNDLLRASPPK
jgi:hypothetical protein